MRHKPNCDVRSRLAERQAIIRTFKNSEDGSLTIFALFLIPMMLILGGMAVDFMRYESKRALIQDTADRASLLAANLEFTQSGDAATVVDDYFTKANLDQYLTGPAIVSENINGRTVEVNAKQPLNTFFLNYIGIDELEAPANSVAKQGVGNVEISLVLDISGSMRLPTHDANGTATGQSKMQAMQAAAKTFINTALQDSNKDRVSLNLVPYSEHVNIGKDMFDRLTTNELHNFSHCIDFDTADFEQSGISMTQEYRQAQHIDHWSTGNELNTTSCPSSDFQEVTAMSQDRSALLSQIDQFEPYTMTSIFLGMKWGLALLDPSARSLVGPGADAAFAGRPAAYSTDANPNDTRKVLVVMTDGQNTETTRVREEFYNTPSHYAHWASIPTETWFARNTFTGNHSISDIEEVFYQNAEGNQLLKASCDAAKAQGVQVFAVAFEAPEDGEAVMADCATSVNHYFNTNGDDLSAVFEAIAEQVTDLRLTQ